MHLVRSFATSLAALLLGAAGAHAAAPGPALSVDGASGRHPINPGIYGVNFADARFAAQTALPLDRWGGNTTDTYNWRIGAANTGSDWYFENVPDCFSDAHGWCSGRSVNDVFGYRDFVAADRAAGARTLFTLPLAGRVASDGRTGHPLTCGFPSSVFAAQDAFDPYDSGCGSGLAGGSQLAADPARDSTPSGAADNGALVADMVSRFGSAAQGGVAYYELGNEPGLWNATHRDMHPQPTSYDELWQRSRDAAAAVKAADPTARVLAFSEWGWPNYFCSALDGAPHVPCDESTGAGDADRAAHGGTPLAEWLLDRFRGYEQAHGTRLLDYLDLHYYAQGGSGTDVTRSLWDPGYTDPSWIGARIQLIPRMRSWVADHYPGTGISLSEYNLSVSSDAVVNAVIQADVLGIFAREGLDLATRWAMPNDGADITDAFLMYRNYDGRHSGFGDVYVSASSADQARLAVYAAQRTRDGAYTVMVVNKTGDALAAPLSLTGVQQLGAPQAWQWAGGAISRIADPQLAAGTLSMTYPAHSLTLLVLPAGTSTSGGPGGGTGGGRRCVVPPLRGRTLAGARRLLRRAHCGLGRVRRPRRVRNAAALRVASQRPRPGTSLIAGSGVSITLAQPARTRR